MSVERGGRWSKVGGGAVIAVALGSACLAGCGYTDIHEVILRQPQPARSRHVEIYAVGQKVGRPFYEMALLQAVGHGGDANPDDVGDAIARRAVALGCDAIVKLRIDQGYSIANAVGVCVRWAAQRAPRLPETAAPPHHAPPPPAPSSTPPTPSDAPPATTPDETPPTGTSL